MKGRAVLHIDFPPYAILLIILLERNKSILISAKLNVNNGFTAPL